jgi:hypothetical protein
MKESIGRTVFYVNHGYYTPKQAVGYNILRFIVPLSFARGIIQLTDITALRL